MASDNGTVKLPIRLAFWIKHNTEHAQEFREWAQRTETSGLGKVAAKLEDAAVEMEKLNNHLQEALNLVSAPGSSED